MKRPIPEKISSALVFLAVSFILFVPMILSNKLNLPPERGDGPDYDAIAYQLVQGNGFSQDWDDPIYREPYLEFEQSYDYLLARTGSSPTAYRPPLYPSILALTYKFFGRVFYPARILNILFIALACTIGYSMMVSRYSILAGIVFVILLLFSRRPAYYASFIMTESLAILLVSSLAWLLFKYSENGGSKFLIGVGLVAGLSILNRTFFILWILPIFVILIILGKINHFPRRKIISDSIAFLVVSLLLPLPWMIRNCIVLNEFMPLGSQGAINMPAAYSNQALDERGVWISSRHVELYQELSPDLTGIEYERRASRLGQSVALEWIRDNLGSVPRLVLYKAYDLWKPRSVFDVVMYGFFVVGGIIYPVKREVFILGGLLTANTLSVALTWSVGNRFLFPVLPLICMLSSLGLLWSFRLAYFYLGRRHAS